MLYISAINFWTIIKYDSLFSYSFGPTSTIQNFHVFFDISFWRSLPSVSQFYFLINKWKITHTCRKKENNHTSCLATTDSCLNNSNNQQTQHQKSEIFTATPPPCTCIECSFNSVPIQELVFLRRSLFGIAMSSSPFFAVQSKLYNNSSFCVRRTFWYHRTELYLEGWSGFQLPS